MTLNVKNFERTLKIKIIIAFTKGKYMYSC